MENVLYDDKTTLEVPFRSRYIDSLYGLRLRLITEKIKGNTTILKTNFQKLISDEAGKDIEVANAIDELFDLIPNIVKNSGESTKGNSLRKTLPQFRVNDDSKNQ